MCCWLADNFLKGMCMCALNQLPKCLKKKAVSLESQLVTLHCARENRGLRKMKNPYNRLCQDNEGNVEKMRELSPLTEHLRLSLTALGVTCA